MTWKIEWDERARKELRKLDPHTQQKILHYTRKRLATAQDPRRFGKALQHELYRLWRYRVGDYRLICQIEDDRLIVLVLAVGHRREIYR